MSAAVAALSEPETLSVDEAARVLGIGRNGAYEAVARGEIPSIRIGKRILVPRRQLLELLDAPQKSAEPAVTGSKALRTISDAESSEDRRAT